MGYNLGESGWTEGHMTSLRWKASEPALIYIQNTLMKMIHISDDKMWMEQDDDGMWMELSGVRKHSPSPFPAPKQRIGRLEEKGFNEDEEEDGM